MNLSACSNRGQNRTGSKDTNECGLVRYSIAAVHFLI
uniref:Uncharacterized protein n=1 Tax=Rhizophora mucronata TaxID=61149 RepID=A0A2P2N3S1_RHIMU